jgi:hypothetical protein
MDESAQLEQFEAIKRALHDVHEYKEFLELLKVKKQTNPPPNKTELDKWMCTSMPFDWAPIKGALSKIPNYKLHLNWKRDVLRIATVFCALVIVSVSNKAETRRR